MQPGITLLSGRSSLVTTLKQALEVKLSDQPYKHFQVTPKIHVNNVKK